jgi:hypothetical protein
MITELVPKSAGIELELERKRSELAVLEAELSQQELELLTFRTELLNFQAAYLKALGPLYAELDRIEAENAECRARLRPDDRQARLRAERARARAEDSARAAGQLGDADPEARPKPTEALKKLYRDFAKRFHPDLATDEAERRRLEKLMAEANQAYSGGDEARLRQLVEQGEKAPEMVRGDGPAAELERVLRKIAQVRERLRAIADETAELKGSSLFQLRQRAKDASEHGLDLIREMAGFLNREIAKALRRAARFETDRA